MDRSSGFDRILFLGNSHTYRHDVPKLFAGLVKAAGRWKNLDVESSTDSHVALEWHWQNDRSRDLIAAGGWDYVVLQERSTGPLEDPDGMFHYARLLNAEIRKKNGRVAFYMTWANQHRIDTQKIIRNAYETIADELGALVVPVGAVWENAMAADPHLCLYEDDGRHANLNGAYLAACVFYAAIYRASPVGLPGVIGNDGISDGKLAKSRVLFLQEVAHRTVLDS